jgi:hypothetical protein
MTTIDRLNKIAQAKEKKLATKAKVEIEKREQEQIYREHILAYGKRIKAIMDIANALVDAGYPLGKYDCFISNSYKYNFGIIANGSTYFNNVRDIQGVGYRSSGENCYLKDLIVNSDSIISFCVWGTCQDWDEDFVNFEKKFYEFVDSL